MTAPRQVDPEAAVRLVQAALDEGGHDRRAVSDEHELVRVECGDATCEPCWRAFSAVQPAAGYRVPCFTCWCRGGDRQRRCLQPNAMVLDCGRERT